MRKIIEQRQDSLVVCDNENCDYEVPYNNDTNLIEYINKSCPKCGENLLTIEDYIAHERLLRTIRFINKWFSWLTVFNKKGTKYGKEVSIHYHDGTTTIK